ncbi:SMI1/KNR4 family protein [Salinisphaera sp. Q1T1-3]|uniref:SMI1/KNR4 family protein n=1 Tax=Salinisphaera sp. Q1T1-3 TaxID=2321229 RepID=UPI000E73AC35|nr:SMI1/KNR4 family protein [Salinisphaera sp. Q1T1-3]RJS93693.1 SMI1/KNR4 family protein [Salinisphaera sp. Q1T1-3]
MAFSTDIRFIRQAEAALGVVFPAALTARLRCDNGGELDVLDADWRLHPVFDDSDARRAKRTASHIVQETMAARAWPGFPAQAIAIATDGDGNQLVLLPAAEGTALLAAVHVWWHEDGELERVAASCADLQDL